MILLMKILVTIVAATAGAHIGFRSMVAITISAVGIFAAFSVNKYLFNPISLRFALFMPKEVAMFATFMILTAVPIFFTFRSGRTLLEKLRIDKDNPGRSLNAILGSAFAGGVAACILILV